MKKSVGKITGELNQQDRNLMILRFGKGEFKVLVTTNLLARGYDEKKVSMVVNLDLPLIFQGHDDKGKLPEKVDLPN